jgi:hypothetical protein
MIMSRCGSAGIGFKEVKEESSAFFVSKKFIDIAEI